ncbi:MAG: type I DNA topoisomerase [Clostridia bacterium]|nr:type I DNA topoisomerase [Clostridia bacterium]
MSKLVVIEGIGKRETIQKYLGSDYEVFATKGHVRDLPVKSLAIDMENHFEPKYELMPDKKTIVANLKEKAKKSEKVYLATDPDREGEAISWHIAHILGLNNSDNIRIEFNEISKNAITKALEKPRAIDINLVDAQQARRVLDRLVGYKVSPIISKKIQPKLSAGRVQSVTLELVVDREREIQNFKPEEYWQIVAKLSKQNDSTIFNATLTNKDGKKIKVESEKQKDEVLDAIKGKDFKVSAIKRSITKSNPPAPYITSTMQQDALNKLNMSLKQTSSAAQNLYEGVEIKGEGKTALITYIRTDSVRVSPQMQEIAKTFITEKYGKNYVPEKPNIFKTKQSAQDAHEAIRPIHLEITPEVVKGQVENNLYKLYKLIYERFLASQMVPATYNSVSIDIDAGAYTFKASGRTPIFDGYTKVYQEYQSKEKDDETEQKLLPELTEGEILNCHEIKTEQKFTKPPARYTEASLVKVMEEKGIGRPATYVPTITTLERREYTEKDGKQIKPTELGFVVCDTLKKHFPDIMDITFTAKMEDTLDEISTGKEEWHKVIEDFYKDFKIELEKASGSKDKVERPVEVSDVVCDKCGAKMVVRVGQYGKFLACPNFPNCKNIKSIEIKVGVCPKCHKDILEKTSHAGKKFYGCSGYPDCDFVAWDKPTNRTCPKCNDILLKKGGRTYCHNQSCDYYEYEKKAE